MSIYICLIASLLTFTLVTHANVNEPSTLAKLEQHPSKESTLGLKKISNINCAVNSKETSNAGDCRQGEVKTNSATWLFLVALIGFVLLINKRS